MEWRPATQLDYGLVKSHRMESLEMMCQNDDQRIRQPIENAAQASASGYVQEADRLLRLAQAEAPRHPLVLNETASRLLMRGDAAGAQALLKQAVTEDPSQAAIWLNLAVALRVLGRSGEEMAAIDQVLTLEPRNYCAMLQKASLLELQGQRRAAAMNYRYHCRALRRVLSRRSRCARFSSTRCGSSPPTTEIWRIFSRIGSFASDRAVEIEPSSHPRNSCVTPGVSGANRPANAEWQSNTESSTLAPQSIHKNVDEAPRARLPTRVGIPIAHSDHCTQQVRWIDVLAYRAAGNRTLYERRDRACDQFHRSCMQSGRAGHHRSQRWCDQAFGGDVVDKQVHPFVQRFGRWPGLE